MQIATRGVPSKDRVAKRITSLCGNGGEGIEEATWLEIG